MRVLSRILVTGAAALSLLLGLPAQAATVQWRFDGVFTDVVAGTGTEFPAQIAAGLPWTMWVRFNTQPAVGSKQIDPNDGTGAQYRFLATDVQMYIAAGNFGPFAVDNERASDRIIVRDDFFFGGRNVDGFSVASTDLGGPGDSEFDSFGLILRGPVLNLFNLDFDNPTLPALPPGGLADLDIAVLNVCLGFVSSITQDNPSGTCDRGAISGDVLSIRAVDVDDPTRVPTPASLALAGLGLLVLPLSRRRPARVPGSCA